MEGRDAGDADGPCRVRGFERFVQGRPYWEAPVFVQRLCGICPVTYQMTSVRALEGILGIDPPAEIRLLRRLMYAAEWIESHALHVFALALPDFLGFDSLIALAERYPDEVTFALRLKQLGNHIQSVIGGRAVHPINTLVGGFGKLPSHREIEELRSHLKAVIGRLTDAVGMVASIDVPDWAAQPTLFVALRPKRPDFGFRGDEICTSGGAEFLDRNLDRRGGDNTEIDDIASDPGQPGHDRGQHGLGGDPETLGVRAKVVADWQRWWEARKKER